MTTSNESDNRLDRIEAALEKLSDDLGQMREEQDRGRKWEDRTWDVVKWVGGISAGLSISAAIALVGLLVRLSIEGK
ncbi:MAG: hypothetical protein KME14_26650 [Tildeniella torsiva UHER 1998/13D]|jgi:predicted phosphoribosyltransferase|nr:hypothetical protein [Tildeniella torsiva UHER 1998/13D]